ncbi:MAG: hypothetical protein IJX22_06700 [Opitutales bacterium]|nr:hypothetical protein [Opitutales bacterium]
MPTRICGSHKKQLAEIYCTTQENVSIHISNIYADGELDQDRTNKKFLLVRREGSRDVKRNIDHYSLDMIIAKTPGNIGAFLKRD